MNASLVSMPVLVGSIATALIFDFLNGLHDSANAMATVVATVVATRMLRPLTAVVWASFFNVNALCLIDLPHPPAKTDSP